MTRAGAAAQPEAPASALPQGPPLGRAKTVFLIRHGEGWHNVGFEGNHDAHLTRHGWAQAAALNAHLAARAPQLGIELVVVSPLRRTLETTAGVLGAAAPPAGGVADGSPARWALMHPAVAKPREVAERAALFLPALAAAGTAGAAAAGSARPLPLPLLAHEGCRERIGPNLCDSYRDIPLQARDFPGVDFSLVQHTTDEAWAALHAAPCDDAGCYRVGEEESACEARALAFYAWLMARPEQRIAVVSHCGFLVHGMRALGRTMLQQWSDAMLARCSSKLAAAATAASASGSSLLYDGAAWHADDAELAEALRLTAGELTGHMAVDWANCEMRSIFLAPGPRLHGTSQGGGPQPAWLWAAPGDRGAWWPGGLAGL